MGGGGGGGGEGERVKFQTLKCEGKRGGGRSACARRIAGRSGGSRDGLPWWMDRHCCNEPFSLSGWQQTWLGEELPLKAPVIWSRSKPACSCSGGSPTTSAIQTASLVKVSFLCLSSSLAQRPTFSFQTSVAFFDGAGASFSPLDSCLEKTVQELDSSF